MRCIKTAYASVMVPVAAYTWFHNRRLILSFRRSSPIPRAALGIGFQSPYQCISTEKPVGIPTESPYSQNPEIFHTYTLHPAFFRCMHALAVCHDAFCVSSSLCSLSLSVVEDIPKRGGLRAILLVIELTLTQLVNCFCFSHV